MWRHCTDASVLHQIDSCRDFFLEPHWSLFVREEGTLCNKMFFPNGKLMGKLDISKYKLQTHMDCSTFLSLTNCCLLSAFILLYAFLLLYLCLQSAGVLTRELGVSGMIQESKPRSWISFAQSGLSWEVGWLAAYKLSVNVWVFGTFITKLCCFLYLSVHENICL